MWVGKAEYIVHPEQYTYQKADGEIAHEPVVGDAYAQRLSAEVQVKYNCNSRTHLSMSPAAFNYVLCCALKSEPLCPNGKLLR